MSNPLMVFFSTPASGVRYFFKTSHLQERFLGSVSGENPPMLVGF